MLYTNHADTRIVAAALALFLAFHGGLIVLTLTFKGVRVRDRHESLLSRGMAAVVSACGLVALHFTMLVILPGTTDMWGHYAPYEPSHYLPHYALAMLAWAMAAATDSILFHDYLGRSHKRDLASHAVA